MQTTTHNAATGTTIAAAFAGFCRKCGRRYPAGASITKTGFKIWVHAECADSSSTTTSASDSAKVGDVPVNVAALVAEEVAKAVAKAEQQLLDLLAAQTPPAAPAVVPAPTPAPTMGSMDASEIRGVVRSELEGATLQVDDADIRPVVRDELEKAGVTRHEIVVKAANGETRTVQGKPHAKLDRVVKLAAARKNVLLVGPAGCGKTHLAAQVAECLGLSFAFISCSAGMSEGQLLGRLIPTGESGKFEYVRSEFVRCFEEGGVFLFDEIDAADSNTLLVLNAALANGHMAVANRPGNPVAKKHPDFICIAAANTFGTGADRQYVGRNQLDESTLDRFRIGQIEMDYDGEIEAQLCPDEALRTRLQTLRKKVNQSKVRRLVSMRFLRDAYDMKVAGFTDADIDEALFAGWTRDELAKVGHNPA